MSEHIDPRLVHVDALARDLHAAESFQDVMADQLRHAPWLAISILVHAVAVLVLLSIPASVREHETLDAVVNMAPSDDALPDLEKPPEPPEKPVPPDPNDPVMQNTDIVAADEVDRSSEIDDEQVFDDSDIDLFEHADNPIGIAGGDLGIRGDRTGGRGRMERGRPIPQALGIGLRWLAKHQHPDGRWSSADYMRQCPADDLCDGAGNPVNDAGVTGLALLALLGDGSSMRGGEFQKQVKAATLWILDQQDDRGLIGPESGRQFMYNHAIAALALIESYGLSRYRTLERYAQRATDFICKSRNPYKVWRYYPHDGDNDTSVTGWMVFALKSAKDFGLRVDAGALKYSLAWFDECTDPSTGQCGYTKRGEGSSRELGMSDRFPSVKSEAMTATALLCRIFLGETPEAQPLLRTAADALLKKPPVWNTADGSIDMYYWYYASYAMFQLGGSHWRKWRKHMERSLLEGQRKDGHARGSWNPVGAWGHAGGRVYATAIGVLCLEVYYRYSSLIR